MNCEKVLARLSEYHDGELDASLTEEFETHLSRCNSCASELASFDAIGAGLRSSIGTNHPIAPTWEQFAASVDASTKKLPSSTTSNVYLKFALISVGLAASIFILVSLNASMTSNSAARNDEHGHEHVHKSGANSSTAVVIDFEKLLDDESSPPTATLDRLSKSFDGQEAGVDESEAQLGYKPSISQALPSGVKLVSNRILKLPKCNCAAGACNCGPAGCNCAASLCKRDDGTEFLIVEHCATQSISFGHMNSELLHDKKNEVQLMNTGKQFVASWITDHRRLTAIGLNDKTEALRIVASVSSR